MVADLGFEPSHITVHKVYSVGGGSRFGEIYTSSGKRFGWSKVV